MNYVEREKVKTLIITIVMFIVTMYLILVPVKLLLRPNKVDWNIVTNNAEKVVDKVIELDRTYNK